MAVELAEHIHQMTNAELNGVAKLRFTDKATQVELARLCKDARDFLLAGRANSVKFNLLCAGHLNEHPTKIAELYYALKGFHRLDWWRLSPFVRSGHVALWGRRSVDSETPPPPNTPLEVLEDIHQTLREASKSELANGAHGGYSSYNARTLEDVVGHPNASERMAVIASTSENEIIRQAGFDRLVALEKERANGN